MIALLVVAGVALLVASYYLGKGSRDWPKLD